MKVFERLKKRIEKEFNITIPSDAVIHRTYAGKRQKEMGSAVWALWWHEGTSEMHYGSGFSATELLKAKKWSTLEHDYTVEIFPEGD